MINMGRILEFSREAKSINGIIIAYFTIMTDKNKSLKVSVLCPYYNGADYIEQTLESIKAQTYDNIEVIVTDDASPDKGQFEFLQSLQDKYDFKIVAHQHNQGSARTLSSCYQASIGDYIVMTGQDDWFYPEKIQKSVDFMQANPDFVSAYHLLDLYFQKQDRFEATNWNSIRQLQHENQIFPRLYVINIHPLMLQGIIMKRAFVDKEVSPLWQKHISDDWPVHIRCFEKYPEKIGLLDESLGAYRIHDRSLSKNALSNLILCLDTVNHLCPKEYQHEATLSHITRYIQATENKK